LRGRYKSIIENPHFEETFPINIETLADKEKVDVALTSIREIVIPYLTRYSVLNNLVNDLREKKFDYARAVTSIKGWAGKQ
jgi:hypothetical protein